MKRPNFTPLKASLMRTHSDGSVQRYSSSEYKAIFETVLIGSFVLVAILTISLLISYGVYGNTYVLGRILICGGGLLYLAATYGAWAKRRHLLASCALVLFYYLIATVIMFGWGIDITFAQLMLAVTIVLAGVFLGSRGVFITASLGVLAMFAAQAAITVGKAPWFTPTSHTNFADIIGFATPIAILALITGLFDRRTQELHTEDLELNKELTKEKSSLEQRVRSHSIEIEHLQLEQAEQLYRFAEIGQLSTLLLHDLSNHLTVLNIDLADLKREKGSTAAHLEESINQIEKSVMQAARHLQGKEEMQTFDVRTCIESSTKLPRYQELKESISVSLPPEPVQFYGDPLRLSHILYILIRNALEAYPRTTPSDKRTVSIRLETNNDNTIVIRVIDYGRGIPKAIREQLFSPLASNKKGGLGIGLFIAKEITESYFGGTLRLSDTTEHTEFVLTMPKRQAES
jgi:signal transduction histidine kinase